MEAAALTQRRRRSPHRIPVLALVLVAVPLALALAFAWIYESARADRIAPGVRIDGIDVGGLSSDAAYLRLQGHFHDLTSRTITIHGPLRDHTLTAQQAGLTVDTRAMVDQALAATHQGSFVSRAARDLFGGGVSADVRPRLSYSHGAVRRLVAEIAGETNKPPRNATVVPTAAGLTEQPSATGVYVNATRLAERIEHAITGQAPPSTIVVPLKIAQPTVTQDMLASQYPAYIVVDRAHYALRFYEHLKLASTYQIAVGRQGLETPAGLYSVQWKEVNPSWHVPNSAWAGSLAGQTIPPGPNDPIKARWMAFDGGAGIHGIDPSEYSSIGHSASHGCVRMRIPDVIALYSRTPVGTPVFVA